MSLFDCVTGRPLCAVCAYYLRVNELRGWDISIFFRNFDYGIMRNKEKKNWNILTYMYIHSKKNKLFKNLRIYKNMELKFKENN